MSDVVYVVEKGRYTEAELKAMPAIEVPRDILESAEYMNRYGEKVLQRDEGEHDDGLQSHAPTPTGLSSLARLSEPVL